MSCVAGTLHNAGITSNHSRTSSTKDPFTTSAESTALAAGGAPA